MSPQDPNIYKRLLERDYWRICQLATTAEHKERIYKTSKAWSDGSRLALLRSASYL